MRRLKFSPLRRGERQGQTKSQKTILHKIPDSVQSTIWLWITVIITFSTFGLSSMSSIPKAITMKFSIMVILTLRTFGIYSMSDAPEFVIYIYNHFDAFLHAIEYGILTWCMLMYFHTIRYTVRQTIRAYVGAFFFAGIIGFLNELWQMHVPHRSPSGSDVLANFIGAALFIGLFHFIKMRKVKNVS